MMLHKPLTAEQLKEAIAQQVGRGANRVSAPSSRAVPRDGKTTFDIRILACVTSVA
jgi:hypothetical protein